MKTIILDTNFLMIPAQFKLDIFTAIDKSCLFNYKLAVVDGTVKELQNLIEKSKGKDKEAAKLALSFITRKKIPVIKTPQQYHVDKEILALVKKDKHIVATQDIILRKKLKAKNIPRIVMRNKSYIQILDD
ncbi:MAG TPA: hypothetical protein QGI39_13730 [Gammaproteobacteria bacterium]|jgi:hypothetical protein|nr:hypothetical protein [Gammaproteobacteria bacterium]